MVPYLPRFDLQTEVLGARKFSKIVGGELTRPPSLPGGRGSRENFGEVRFRMILKAKFEGFRTVVERGSGSEHGIRERNIPQGTKTGGPNGLFEKFGRKRKPTFNGSYLRRTGQRGHLRTIWSQNRRFSPGDELFWYGVPISRWILDCQEAALLQGGQLG